MPKVGVVMTVWNPCNVEWLRNAVKCILKQTHTDWHFVIIDDGSDEPIEPLIRDLVADHRIDLHRMDKHDYLGDAINSGLKKLEEDCMYETWFAFDDELYPMALEAMSKRLDETGNDIAYGNCDEEFNGEYVPWLTASFRPGEKRISFNRHYNKNDFKNNWFLGIAFMWRRNSRVMAGPWFWSAQYELYELFLKIEELGKPFDYVNSPLALHREHTKTLTSRNRVDPEAAGHMNRLRSEMKARRGL